MRFDWVLEATALDPDSSLQVFFGHGVVVDHDCVALKRARRNPHLIAQALILAVYIVEVVEGALVIARHLQLDDALAGGGHRRHRRVRDDERVTRRRVTKSIILHNALELLLGSQDNIIVGQFSVCNLICQDVECDLTARAILIIEVEHAD